MGPCHRVLENKINKNKQVIKNGVIGQITKMNFGGLGLGAFGNLGVLSDFTGNSSKTKINSNKKVMVNDFNNLESFFKNQNDKTNKLNAKTQEPTSELNKYILEESKNSSNKSNNNKSNAKMMIIDDFDFDFNVNNTTNNDLNITDIEEPLDTILLNNKTSNSNVKIVCKNDTSGNDNIEDFLNKMKNIEKKVKKITIVSDEDDLSSFVNKNAIFDQNNKSESESESESESDSDSDSDSGSKAGNKS